MPASRLWKKPHEDMYFILLSSFRRIHLDGWMFNYLCSCLKGKTFHIVDLYAVPTWKDKNVGFFFSSIMYLLTEREFFWEKAQKFVIFVHAQYFVTILLGKREVQGYHTISILEQAGG